VSIWRGTKSTTTEAVFSLLYQACMTDDDYDDDDDDDDDACGASGGKSDRRVKPKCSAKTCPGATLSNHGPTR
jgi:hypothetical protein